jgi:hypothetical protein
MPTDDLCTISFSFSFMIGICTKTNSYVENLDASYVRALLETASNFQEEALRDAIWKHLALEASLRVSIRVCVLRYRDES